MRCIPDSERTAAHAIDPTGAEGHLASAECDQLGHPQLLARPYTC